MSREPQRGDKVIDQLGKEDRSGVVVGSTSVQGELFIKVKFDNQKKWEEPEQLEYGSHFTKHNCGWGRWDQDKRCWMIEKSGDELPDDDPFVVSMNEQMKKANIDFLLKRIAAQMDLNLNIIQIEVTAISYELDSKNCGDTHPYKSYYESKAKDYRDFLHYRLHGKLPE